MEDGIRYLIRFSDGGAGMRTRIEPLEIGQELHDCGERHIVIRVDPPPSDSAFGHAWAELEAARRGQPSKMCRGPGFHD